MKHTQLLTYWLLQRHRRGQIFWIIFGWQGLQQTRPHPAWHSTSFFLELRCHVCRFLRLRCNKILHFPKTKSKHISIMSYSYLCTFKVKSVTSNSNLICSHIIWSDGDAEGGRVRLGSLLQFCVEVERVAEAERGVQIFPDQVRRREIQATCRQNSNCWPEVSTEDLWPPDSSQVMAAVFTLLKVKVRDDAGFDWLPPTVAVTITWKILMYTSSDDQMWWVRSYWCSTVECSTKCLKYEQKHKFYGNTFMKFSPFHSSGDHSGLHH